jgi:hypothetical protein
MTNTTRNTPTTSATVERFVAAVRAGTGIPADLYAPDAVLDATVPNWRFTVRGPEAIAAEYGRWFYHPASFDELALRRVDDGEVVTYLQTWDDEGVPHAAHHCHVLTLDNAGRIVRDEVFCGGRWDAALLAEMAAADDAG